GDYDAVLVGGLRRAGEVAGRRRGGGLVSHWPQTICEERACPTSSSHPVPAAIQSSRASRPENRWSCEASPRGPGSIPPTEVPWSPSASCWASTSCAASTQA